MRDSIYHLLPQQNVPTPPIQHLQALAIPRPALGASSATVLFAVSFPGVNPFLHQALGIIWPVISKEYYKGPRKGLRPLCLGKRGHVSMLNVTGEKDRNVLNLDVFCDHPPVVALNPFENLDSAD